jgi:hypothetical protein
VPADAADVGDPVERSNVQEAVTTVPQRIQRRLLHVAVEPLAGHALRRLVGGVGQAVKHPLPGMLPLVEQAVLPLLQLVWSEDPCSSHRDRCAYARW